VIAGPIRRYPRPSPFTTINCALRTIPVSDCWLVELLMAITHFVCSPDLSWQAQGEGPAGTWAGLTAGASVTVSSSVGICSVVVIGT
jgi:hypothetical protein